MGLDIDLDAIQSLITSIEAFIDSLTVLVPMVIALFCVYKLVKAIALGIAVRRLARHKGMERSFFQGFFFGIFALIYVAGLPARILNAHGADETRPVTRTQRRDQYQ